MTPFDIFLNVDRRMNLIDDPLQMDILRMLKRGPLHMKDLVSECGHPQSTVSVATNDLRIGGLVEFRADGRDSRRKILSLTGAHLATTLDPERNQDDGLKDIVSDIAEGRGEIFENLFSVFLIGLRRAGLCMDPWIEEIGRAVGSQICQAGSPCRFEEVLDKLNEFFYENWMVRIDVETKIPLVIVAKVLGERSKMEFSERAFCCGVLSSGISTALDGNYNVSCEDYIEGEQGFRFVIEKVSNCERPECMILA